MLMEAKPLFLLLSLVLLLRCPANGAFRIGLTHVDSNNNNMALEELVKRAVDRSKYRMGLVQAKLSNSTFDVQVPTHFGGNVIEYYMDFSIGTPPVPITAVMDTGSDLVWTQCRPCIHCVPQNTTIYDPSKSSTFTQVPCATPLCQALGANADCNSSGQCNYVYSYGDNSSTKGFLGYETFTLGHSSVGNIGFGCGQDNAGTTGIVGLGQGNLSLPSQLNTGKFSYCLSVDSNSSLLLLGPSASLNESSAGTVKSTPILSDTRYYYIALQGISLGATLLPIPNTTFQYNAANGTGGTIIDSGTSLTFLQQRAYDILKQEIVSLVNLPPIKTDSSTSLDLCFKVTSWPPPSMPDMTFHFDRADMTVPPENYMIGDQQSGLVCLLVLPSSFPVSILGNLLQQNIHILYDLDNGMLSFVPAQCDQL